MAGERLGECRAGRALTPAHLLRASPRGLAERREGGGRPWEQPGRHGGQNTVA